MTEKDGLSGKFNRSAIQVEEAQRRILPFIKKLNTELVPLLDARGRILAADIMAPHPYPHFRRSMMDGFAIKSSDTAGCSQDNPIRLEVTDEIPAGSLPSVVIREGTAARIMTGAKVPDSADAVVMLEMAHIQEGSGKTFISLADEAVPGQHIIPRGFELEEGDLLLESGRLIGPGEITVLATFGIDRVEVARKPRVAICSTGSELLEIGEPLADGKIRNSNTYTLACQVAEAGGAPYVMDAILDDLYIAKQRVEEALSKYDLVITTGGVSVGDFDIMADLVQDHSMELLFNKVAMRPGSVTTAAVSGEKLLFALSGNPGASFIAFELFVRPALRLMMGAKEAFLPAYEAVLTRDYARTNSFTRYVRAKLECREGILHVHPAQLDESGVMITIKDADVLLVVPPNTAELRKGDRVQVIGLPR